MVDQHIHRKGASHERRKQESDPDLGPEPGGIRAALRGYRQPLFRKRPEGCHAGGRKDPQEDPEADGIRLPGGGPLKA